MVIRQNLFMDIYLINTQAGVQLSPASIHGMLWLQTHFEETSWEAIATNQVIIPVDDSEILGLDAKKAGLSIKCLSSLTISAKF